MARKLPGLSPASPGTLLVCGLVDGAISSQGLKNATLAKARRRTSTALDRALAACPRVHPAGLRIPLIDGSEIDRELAAAAKRIDPNTRYATRGYPSEAELDRLCHFRFRRLDGYYSGDWMPDRTAMDPIAEEALRVCHHPTASDVASALGVLFADVRLRTEAPGRRAQVESGERNRSQARAGDRARQVRSVLVGGFGSAVRADRRSALG